MTVTKTVVIAEVIRKPVPTVRRTYPVDIAELNYLVNSHKVFKLFFTKYLTVKLLIYMSIIKRNNTIKKLIPPLFREPFIRSSVLYKMFVRLNGATWNIKSI